MDTIKISEKQQTQIIAHRGCSGLETENTNAAFVAAGNRSYYGIETDIHLTADGNFIVIHDDTTARVAGDDLVVEETDYASLREMLLFHKDGQKSRYDLHMSSVEEYIGICKYYEKKTILELKNSIPKNKIYELCDRIDALGYLEEVIFISFDVNNLIAIREKYPNQKIQYLIVICDEENYADLVKYHFDLDISQKRLTKELVDKCHGDGIKVNCWTVDKLERAETLISWGVDYITTNILE